MKSQEEFLHISDELIPSSVFLVRVSDGIEVDDNNIEAKVRPRHQIPKDEHNNKDNNNDPHSFKSINSIPENCPLIFLHFISPLYKTLHFLFLPPSKFEYDSSTHSHVRVKGSILKMVIIILLQLGNLFFLWNHLQRLAYGQANVGIIYRIMYVCFIILAISFYHVLWLKSESIAMLLVRIENLTHELMKDDQCKFPKQSFVTGFVWTLIGLNTAQALLHSIVIEIAQGDLSNLINPSTWLNLVTREAELNFYYGTGLIDEPTNVSSYSLTYSLLVGIPYFLIVFYSTITWIFAFVSLLLWSILFRKLFQIYFDSMKNYEARRRNPFILENIRLFQKITILIEDFNLIFGQNILFCITSCILFLSKQAWSIFGSFSSNIGVNLLILATFITTTLILIVCSEVHNMSHQMSMSIKIYFQQQELWRDLLKADERNGEELTQGLMMIQHDLSCNNIGLKGYGFFTLSYSFMGTIISILVTYSILFQQWQNSNNSTNTRQG